MYLEFQVPQGLMLRPLLFKFFKDIFFAISDIDIASYASTVAKNIHDLINLLEEDLFPYFNGLIMQP